VARVTGLTKDALRNSPSFAQAFNGLIKFIGKERATLCFWGNDDMRELFRNILYCRQSARRLPLKYINVQRMASLHLDLPAKQQMGLATVVNALDIEADLAFHSAPNDAFYTAEIFRLVYNEDNIELVTFDLEQLKQRNASILAALADEKLEVEKQI